MLSLALDTSASLASVALGEDGRLLAESATTARAAHSETVLPEIDRLLEDRGRSPGELDRIVVGSGPGSFTGVRIGASLAKGLCAAGGAELFAFSSLEAVAAGVGGSGAVCALLPARSEELYAAAFPGGAEAGATVGPVVLRVSELLGRLEGAADPDRWTFAGLGATEHRSKLESWGGRVLGAGHAHPRAAVLLDLAERRGGEGRIGEPADWEPTYVRASGAERGR